MKNLTPILILLAFFLCCDSQVPAGFKGASVYRTANFRIHFHEATYNSQEIQTIAQKKERLLQRITNILQVDFNKVIETYLHSTGYVSYAYSDRPEVHETRYYVEEDNGHEIAHIVVFDKLGYNSSQFMVEGIAVMLEYNRLDPITTFQNLFAFNRNCYYSMGHGNTIGSRFLDNTFTGSWYEYKEAGAFLYYLSQVYGIEAVKELYKAGVGVSKSNFRETTEMVFVEIFDISFKEAETYFVHTYLHTVIGHLNHCLYD
ncbi:hypothetical protein QA601_05830 [Chitinispirillales bacterium ANBcel5]|uniref:hypothetical protein n=1 Tax=Cellulosispirillum alkaliphilum TaxID=3039283 RepID=UPI002A58A786|nr:hypothetical protein [Chitinispirillales bacterium ANBcel5]